MIYVVTSSADYYPCAGADDWELVTRDLEGAKARAFGLYDEMPDRVLGSGKCGSVYVLAINEDNLHVHELDVWPQRHGKSLRSDQTSRTP